MRTHIQRCHCGHATYEHNTGFDEDLMDCSEEFCECDKYREVAHPKAWKLFYSLFSEYDEIMIVTSDDVHYFGYLRNIESDSFQLSHTKKGLAFGDSYTNNLFYWEDIRFMSHDGFPVKKLLGADGSKMIEAIETKSKIKAIREAFDIDLTPSWAVFGDPYLIEGVESKIYHPGRDTYLDYLKDEEECIVLTSRDGAKAQLFDLSTIYFHG